MERIIEFIPNYTDTILVYGTPKNRGIIKKVEGYEFDENGECEIEFHFQDGIAKATDGSGLTMTYPKLEEIRQNKYKQKKICEYNGIDDSINQYDVCLKYGVLSVVNGTLKWS